MADQSAWQQNMCGNFLPRGWCWCAEAGGRAECPITTSLMSSPRPWPWSNSGLAEYRNYQIIERASFLQLTGCASEFFKLSLKSLPQSSSEPWREGQAAHATLLQSPIVSLLQHSTQIEASFAK